MTDNMKRYLELISKDEEARKKLADYEAKVKEQTVKDMIAYAAKNGITLTEADFAAPVPEGELNEDELDAVSGGACGCVLGGGGKGKDAKDGKTYNCACVAYGQGGDGDPKDTNCWCPGAGSGDDNGYDL